MQPYTTHWPAPGFTRRDGLILLLAELAALGAGLLICALF